MISESMNLTEKKESPETVMLPVDRLVPSDENFYSRDDERVRKLAATIEVLATGDHSGVQDNLVVRPIAGTDQYEILAGETRWSAVKLLLEEKRIQSGMVPCRVEDSGDPLREELILIFTNSTQRVRSDAEKMHEVERIRELLTEYKKTHPLGGTVQQAIAEILSISKTKVGTLDNINRNLVPDLKTVYEADKMKTSTANKLAGMEKEEQEQFWDWACSNGKERIASADVEQFRESEILKEELSATYEGEPLDGEETEQGSMDFSLDITVADSEECDQVEEKESMDFSLDITVADSEGCDQVEDQNIAWELESFQTDIQEPEKEGECGREDRKQLMLDSIVVSTEEAIEILEESCGLCRNRFKSEYWKGPVPELGVKAFKRNQTLLKACEYYLKFLLDEKRNM